MHPCQRSSLNKREPSQYHLDLIRFPAWISLEVGFSCPNTHSTPGQRRSSHRLQPFLHGTSVEWKKKCNMIQKPHRQAMAIFCNTGKGRPKPSHKVPSSSKSVVKRIASPGKKSTANRLQGPTCRRRFGAGQWYAVRWDNERKKALNALCLHSSTNFIQHAGQNVCSSDCRKDPDLV